MGGGDGLIRLSTLGRAPSGMPPQQCAPPLFVVGLLLTMVISGLWHGAAWTFVIWGTLHALATMATRSAEW